MAKKSSSAAESSTSCNSVPAVDTSSAKYKGVRKRKWGKWVSEIRLPNSRERIWLGSYDSPEKAARAFDAAQFCLRGRSANFNFPNNPPEIAGARSMTPAEIQAAAARFANTGHHPEMGPGPDEKEEEEEESSMMSYSSPSMSDGGATTTSTAQIDGDVATGEGVETSFYEQLRLSSDLGSGNYAADFGLFTGFDEFSNGSFYSPPPDNNYDYGVDDTYDASFYQDTGLWNF